VDKGVGIFSPTDINTLTGNKEIKKGLALIIKEVHNPDYSQPFSHDI
jgi:hypothetical protein